MRYFRQNIEPFIDQQKIRYIGPVNSTRKITSLTGALGLLNPITWEEPFGMVMIEAMALGCPVISFARGAAPEIVVQEKTGFLVHSIDEMVESIPLLKQLDRKSIRSYVESTFSAHVMANNYEKVYHPISEDSPFVQVRECSIRGIGVQSGHIPFQPDAWDHPAWSSFLLVRVNIATIV